MHLKLLLCLAALSLSACAPCQYDNGIVSGELTDSTTGDPVEDGLVHLTPSTGDVIVVNVFGDGLYEASVPAGTYEVVGWSADEQCFSAIADLTFEPCDEPIVDLVLIDCF